MYIWGLWVQILLYECVEVCNFTLVYVDFLPVWLLKISQHTKHNTMHITHNNQHEPSPYPQVVLLYLSMGRAAAPSDLSTVAPCGSIADAQCWACPRDGWLSCLGHFFCHIKNRERDGALTLGGRCFMFRCKNRPIVGICSCLNDRAEARPGPGRSSWGPH
jgi:hypothetical protein